MSQSAYYPGDNRIYPHVDRLNNLYQIDTIIHHSARNISRNQIFDLLKSAGNAELTSIDQQINEYFLPEGTYKNPIQGQGFWQSLYYNPTHLFEYQNQDFEVIINPMLNFTMGNDFENDAFVFENTRGLEITGGWDNKFYFYTAFLESQAKPLNYIEPYIQKYFAFPGQGNYKDYQSKVIDGFRGYDYSNARAYLGYRLSRHTNLELGHNKHFIGNGIRSLLLSDSGHNYFYLKFQLKIWKLQYQSIFAELASISARMNPGNELLPKKYMANHYLSFRPSRALEVGLFETVVFSRENIFELQYLNPLILYRSIEHQLDSPDNVLLGLNVAWNPGRGLAFYGQLMLDELNFSQIFSSEKWWGNKYGIQLGLKYFDIAGIKLLDGQLEYNMVRPYTYSHWKPTDVIPDISVSNYGHYNQALAHPLGSNFSELICMLRYKPNRRFFIEARYLYTVVGRNTEQNFGSDILLDNSSRIGDFGISLHQGAKSKISSISFDMSYELFYNFHLDAKLLLRQDNNEQINNYHTTFVSGGIRYNFYQSKVDY